MCAIYKINLPDGRCYIGRTNNFKKRKRKYERRHKRNKLSRAIHRAMAEFKFDDIDWLILEDGLTLKESKEKEKYYISKYRTNGPNGLNKNCGG